MSSTVDQLASQGGNQIRCTPLPPWPVFDEEMIDAVSAVLRSGRVNYWTGEVTRQFEAEFASCVGAQHAIAVANGTLALELALAALDIGPGDEVIVPCRTFVATASAVATRGATPVFADVDPVSQNVTAALIEPLITRSTKAIIPVHLAGWPCEMASIIDLAERYKLYVIEDCAQAHGAAFAGNPVGSIGHFGAFSFCQDKILTTGGEGGMLTTSDESLWRRAWSYKDHGKDWDEVHAPASGRVFKWLHNSIGTNWRLTEMQSAIGRIMIQQLPNWVVSRRQNAATLSKGFSQIGGLTCHEPPVECYHSYYKFYAHLDTRQLRSDWSRDQVVLSIQAEGIPCGSGVCPEIYREGGLSQFAPGKRLPNAQELGDATLMFQVHPTLTTADLNDVVAAVAKVLGHALDNG